jgi:hypothetical protein
MKLIFLAMLSLTFLTGCATKTRYVERQSEELSQAVYGTKDSIEVARIDLAERYIKQASRLVAPPKNRAKIEAIVKSKNEKETERVLILPNSNKNDKVVFVDSPEYLELTKDSRIAQQLKMELQNWQLYTKEVDRKLTEQYEIQNEMIVKIQDLEKQVLEKDKKLLRKDIAILWRNIMIVSLIGVMGVGVYLRIKGVL